MYRFQIIARTQPGESIGLVGSTPELGQWDASRCVRCSNSIDLDATSNCNAGNNRQNPPSTMTVRVFRSRLFGKRSSCELPIHRPTVIRSRPIARNSKGR
ncbi:MAG: hypothetical protein D6728_09515 [Cyanobacteria bacterium J055]|nr:MAG: hypothetical protein D6728_09515 [Cyanobacteria bacterium J055]